MDKTHADKQQNIEMANTIIWIYYLKARTCYLFVCYYLVYDDNKSRGHGFVSELSVRALDM